MTRKNIFKYSLGHLILVLRLTEDIATKPLKVTIMRKTERKIRKSGYDERNESIKPELRCVGLTELFFGCEKDKTDYLISL